MNFVRRGLAVFGLAVALWPTAQAQSDAPAQLRIGFQKSAVNLVILKQQGALEKRFPATRLHALAAFDMTLAGS